jgi:hypothetical protein
MRHEPDWILSIKQFICRPIAVFPTVDKLRVFIACWSAARIDFHDLSRALESIKRHHEKARYPA